LVRDAPLSLPILGVCLGHQSIGQAFGGKVIRAPVIMHGKLSPISHQGDGLFKNLQSPINVTRYHSLIVERETLPANLKVAAETYDGTIMAVEHIDRPVFGVQFHPESIASQAGHQILSNFLEQAGLSSKDVTMPQFDLSNIG
jgi:anthranilate synthase component 2